MKQTIIIFIGISSLLFTACDSRCEKVIDKYNNQNKKVVHVYPDCEDSTIYTKKVFHENGNLSSIGEYKNGQKSGNFKRWTEEGVLLESWGMHEGMEHGFVECWYPNGVKKREASLEYGLENGVWKDWDKDGNLTLIGHFKNGLKDGKWTYFESNGTKKIRSYENDTLSGYTYEYLVDSAETLHVVGQYKDGLETGEWKWFDSDSILYQTLEYSKGEYKGKFIEYYSNGVVKSEGILNKNEYVDEATYYDSLGNVIDKDSP